MTNPSPTIERRALTIAHFCGAYDIGRTKANELMQAGVLTVRHLGRRVLIDADSARAWYANLPAGRGKAA